MLKQPRRYLCYQKHCHVQQTRLNQNKSTMHSSPQNMFLGYTSHQQVLPPKRRRLLCPGLFLPWFHTHTNYSVAVGCSTCSELIFTLIHTTLLLSPKDPNTKRTDLKTCRNCSTFARRTVVSGTGLNSSVEMHTMLYSS